MRETVTTVQMAAKQKGIPVTIGTGLEEAERCYVRSFRTDRRGKDYGSFGKAGAHMLVIVCYAVYDRVV